MFDKTKSKVSTANSNKIINNGIIIEIIAPLVTVNDTAVGQICI